MAKHKKKFKRGKRFTCKWHEPTGYNVHHRLPASRGGSSCGDNLSIVPIKLHNAFNQLFGSNPTAHEVALVLTNIWIDPAFRIVVLPKEVDEHVVVHSPS
jgi:hypothetical protein